MALGLTLRSRHLCSWAGADHAAERGAPCFLRKGVRARPSGWQGVESWAQSVCWGLGGAGRCPWACWGHRENARQCLWGGGCGLGGGLRRDFGELFRPLRSPTGTSLQGAPRGNLVPRDRPSAGGGCAGSSGNPARWAGCVGRCCATCWTGAPSAGGEGKCTVPLLQRGTPHTPGRPSSGRAPRPSAPPQRPTPANVGCRDGVVTALGWGARVGRGPEPPLPAPSLLGGQAARRPLIGSIHPVMRWK